MSVPAVMPARPVPVAPDPSLPSVMSGTFGTRGPARAPVLLRITCLSLFVFPSSMVIEPIGASGTVPLLLTLVLLVTWIASSLWRLHDPVTRTSPIRFAAAIFVLGVLASYAALYGGWSPAQSAEGLASADRWVIFALASLGMILVIGDSVRTMADILHLARWILAGAFFSCVIGVIQFTAQVNPVEIIQSAMPGFTYNGGDTAFQQRGALVRVAGTAFHSIEFGVTSAMLLPLSIWRAMFDPYGRAWFHWLQALLLGFAVVTTVSRSGTLAIAVALAVMMPFLPRAARLRVLGVLPFALLALFLAVPGFIGTIGGALSADSSDPSISTRLNNYPRVARMIDTNPILGTGPGTYLPTNALNILDNQYLNAAVSVGLVGLVCVAIYLIVPGLSLIVAARHARDVVLRSLAGATAAGLLVAAVCSATFDSLSFPVFGLLFPILAGLGGSVWMLVRDEFELSPSTSWSNEPSSRLRPNRRN